MIKIITLTLFSLLSWGVLAEFPRLAFKVGYPIVNIQENPPTYPSDFGAITFGAIVTYKFNLKQELNLNLETTYTPKRRFFSLEHKENEAEGNTSLTTSFYSISFTQYLTSIKGHSLRLSLGPAIGVYTLNFFDIFESDLELDEINRVRVTSTGARLGIMLDNEEEAFYELSVIYSRESKYTLISDATNDAEIIKKIQSIRKVPLWIVSFNVGAYIF